LRHLEIERDDARVERGNLLERINAITGKTHHGEVGFRINHFVDELAHERAVIDNENRVRRRGHSLFLKMRSEDRPA